MVAAALCIAAIPFVGRPFLDVAVDGLDAVSTGAAIGSFFAVLVLFVPPVTLLGLVAPFAVRLAVTDLATAGPVAGRLYALSTVGSLVGTFGAALVAIPAIGTQRTLLATAALVAAGGAVHAPAALARRRPRRRAAAGAARRRQGGGRVLYEHESRYGFVQVVQREASGASTSTRGSQPTRSGGPTRC